MIKIKFLSGDAKLPVRSTSRAAGLDLFCSKDCELLPNSVEALPTQLAVQLPESYYGEIVGRSSSHLKKLDVKGGILDNDYRGEIFVVCRNTNDTPVLVKKHARIGQLLVRKFHDLPLK